MQNARRLEMPMKSTRAAAGEPEWVSGEDLCGGISASEADLVSGEEQSGDLSTTARNHGNFNNTDFNYRKQRLTIMLILRLRFLIFIQIISPPPACQASFSCRRRHSIGFSGRGGSASIQPRVAPPETVRNSKKVGANPLTRCKNNRQLHFPTLNPVTYRI